MPKRLSAVFLAIIVLSLVLGGCSGATNPVKQPVSALQDRYGIEITLVGVTAAGGLIDFRFKVVDAAKAAPVFTEAKLTPQLVVNNRFKLAPTQSTAEVAPETGQIYYLLYPNVQTGVRSGAAIALQIGDLVVGPVMVQ